ncbi:MAG: hypothetical protein QOI06_1482 [Nocardioidaceae bacterium]|nr:hypothetical protein [Nocardioidaceae bacterium]
MAPPVKRLVFGRINRRSQETLQSRPFREDMSALADSHLTRHVQRLTSTRRARTWQAADMALTPDGDFMTGVLGYSEEENRTDFDPASWSWIKGESRESDTASDATMAPFAVDLRDDHRWVAFAVTARLQPTTFTKGFEQVLNEAATVLKLVPTTWEVDLVTSPFRIRDWLADHPRVYKMVRTVKFSNPGLDLDRDRQEMRAMSARRKTEEYAAAPRRSLNVNSDAFNEKLEGTDTGNLDIRMSARGAQGASESRFSTRLNMDDASVPDFGTDLVAGMETVLAALKEYVANRTSQGPAQASISDE